MIDAYIKALLEEQKTIQESFVYNPAPSYEVYMQRVGAWSGIQTAIDVYLKHNDKEDN